MIGFGSFGASLFILAYTSIGFWWIIPLFYAINLGLTLVEVILAVGLKWVILGRQKTGTYPLWGWYYIRWWIVRGIVQTVGRSVLQVQMSVMLESLPSALSLHPLQQMLLHPTR